MKTYLIFITFLISCLKIYSQGDSLVNIFPLEIGFQWNYNYELNFINSEQGNYTEEFGNVTIMVISKIDQSNLVIWNFEETQNLSHHYHNYISQFDTTYPIFNIINYSIYEEPDSAFIINGNASSRVFNFDGIHRFRNVDSSGIFTYTKLGGGHQTVFTFKKDVGLISKVHTFINGHYSSTRENASLINYTLNVDDNNFNLVLAEYDLFQNYPNPFNNSSVIKYSLPTSSKVIIKVFDILGTEIETLVNEEKPNGTYEVTWNAANLPSGVYFYRIQSGNFIDTKKMILLK